MARPYVCERCERARCRQLSIGARAWQAVQRAIGRGELARLPDGRPCVDCGRLAEVWDHREYARPLAVEAVCVSCNKRRGPAVDSGALLPRETFGGEC